MKLKDYVPKSLVGYYRLLRNKKRFPGRNILTPDVKENVDLGENVSLGRNVYIEAGVSIGDETYIHNGTMIVSGDIGKYCSIAFNCQIGMWEHPTNYSTFAVEKVE